MLSATIEEVTAQRWDAVRENVRTLIAALSSGGEEADEWRTLLEEGQIFTIARAAFENRQLDVASDLFSIGQRFDSYSAAVRAFSSGDLELVCALCDTLLPSISEPVHDFHQLFADATTEALFASRISDAFRLALFMMSWPYLEPSRDGLIRQRAERAAAHGFQYNEADEYGLVGRALVAVCRRRRAGSHAAVFESCSASFGAHVTESLELLAESAHCAHLCIERGSPRGLHFQTAITFALREGRNADAEAYKETMATRCKATHVTATWRRATAAVAEFRTARD